MSAKAVVRVAWCEAQERERLIDQLRQANQQALARLVRDLVAKAGPRPKRGRPRGRRIDPLPEATCKRLWKTYRLGSAIHARWQECATEIVALMKLPSETTSVVSRGVKEVVGTRVRELVELTRLVSRKTTKDDK